MDKKDKKSFVVMGITIMILVIQVLVLILTVHSIQGNGRVVNYAGIVRGATQRLVKNELYGKKDDTNIVKLDNIIIGLQTGDRAQNLIALKDEEYQSKLKILAKKWETIKETIYSARKDEEKKETLYTLSEEYFTLADETVSAAENYSDGIAKRLNILEITIFANIVIILAMLLKQVAAEINNNRKLSKIAYVDPHTGLPNKRSCDEKLSNDQILEHDQNACCIMFDLNNLKVTNDTFGHEVGDALIASFASLLRRNMPADMFVGRLGGDEFVGIQMNADQDEVMRKIAEMEKEASQTNIDNEISSINISFAYGCAFSKDHADCTVKMLMNIADKNMYVNKIKKKEMQKKLQKSR